MPHYKFIYFDIRGFGEPTRQLFHLAKVPFEDVRVSADDIVPGKQSESFLKFKNELPFGRVPVLHVDEFVLPQSAAINRYLALKFGFAGKTPEDRAMVDAIVDQYKECMESVRSLFYARKLEKSPEEIEKIRQESVLPTKNNYYRILNKILEKSTSGFLVGDSLTWADLVVADQLFTFNNLKELDLEDPSHANLKKYQERIYNLPELRDYIEKRKFSMM